MTDATADTNEPAARRWEVRGRTVTCAGPPLLMGIVNVTPDSFSDGGQWFDPEAAVAQALRLISDGADIIDVGGESSRPGARAIAATEELRRVVPVIRRIAEQSSVLISADTTKAEVAREALAAGAQIVNDVSGLSFDSQMARVCADASAGVICMHMQGTPETMQVDPQYDDVVSEVRDYLAERLEELEQHGIPRERVAIDPGIGFGKTAEHNVELLSHIGALRELGRPVCIGHSRKRFLKRLLGREIDERLFATVGVAVALALQKAEIIRVHDVAPVRDAILACRALLPTT
ncbi:MAG TPA: dihydropteroate synthase [Planctomycetaceae bacterium]|jgi:dihydropteroate synthase|nr:dihydropteroate synthase [Planctomycetaceae bacterium]